MRMSSLVAMNAYSSTQELLTHKGYIFEPKLDGFRALCYVDKKKVTFISRNGLDITHKYPELDVRAHIKAKTCILDGEIVAYDAHGAPNFNLLQNGGQAVYVVFDILKKDGIWLIKKPLLERKKVLAATIKESPFIEKSFFTTQGVALWKEMVAKNMEGVMAKVQESPYILGVRSKNWLKIKRFNTIDCIIIGYRQGVRVIASLALGLYTSSGSLRYIGNVGTGFSLDFLKTLHKRLKPLELKRPHVDVDIKNIHWVSPRLACEVKYVEITRDGMLRSPAFVRLRPDKKVRDCTVKDQMLSFYSE